MAIINLGLRLFELFMALLVMALTGNAIAMGADSSINNYVMFCAAWAMLFLIYQTLAAAKPGLAGHALIPGIIDILTVIFWFCAAVALAAELGVHSCGSDSYVATNRVIRGASDQHSACREAQASTAFLWFGWAAFVASAVMSFMGGSSSPSGGIRRGPAMSQV